MARQSLAPKIMARIIEHARTENMRQGEHLTAQRLADEFRVSRAPVVSALRQLESIGIVRSEHNRGFFLNSDAATLPALPGGEEDGPADEEIYFRIAEDRLSGRLPDRQSANEFMRLYGLPRARMMVLLHRIEDEGWIDRLPGNGWQFRPTLDSRKAYADAYAFRASVESQALLADSFRPDAEAFAAARADQQEMLRSYQTASRSAIFARNVAFHEMLMRCADNDFFLDAVRRMNRVRRLIEYRITTDRSRLPGQCREHLAILDLIEAGDLQAASDRLFHHISAAGRAKSAHYSESQTVA